MENHLDIFYEKTRKYIEETRTLHDNQMSQIKEKDEVIKSLQDKILALEDDIKNFRKVSHIIALERENSALKEKIAKLTAPAQSANSSLPVTPSLEVYEKKIKGQIFYVDTVDNSTVYKKNDDDTVGECVGHLVKDKDTGKTKMLWKDQ